MPHCWKDYRSWLEENGKEWSPEHLATYDYESGGGNKTCMLENGHEGEHDFVDDGDIVLTFVEEVVH